MRFGIWHRVGKRSGIYLSENISEHSHHAERPAHLRVVRPERHRGTDVCPPPTLRHRLLQAVSLLLWLSIVLMIVYTIAH